MTKSDLIKHVAGMKNLSKGRAEALVNCVFDSLEEALRRGERIEIRGIGSFEIRQYGAYKGRNPRTGAAVAVRPKRLPHFSASTEIKQMLNPSVVRTQELPAVAAETANPARRLISRSA